MAEPSIKDRVYAAAEQISAERNPTVSSVRESAGVSNADATRYLKAWRTEQSAAGTQIAATPPAVIEQATRLAGTLWAEASRLAEATHEALQAQWIQQSKEKDDELAELVADLDTLTTEKDQQIHTLQTDLAASTTRATAADQAAADARAAGEQSRSELARLQAVLAAAEATAAATTRAHDALLARITATDTTNPDDTGTGTGD